MDRPSEMNFPVPDGFTVSADESSKFGMRDALVVVKRIISQSDFYNRYAAKFCSFEVSNRHIKCDNIEAAIYTSFVTVFICVFVYIVATYLNPFLITGDKDEEPKKTQKEDVEEKVLLRDFTVEQLRSFDGSNGKAIYIALRMDVYDVSIARDLYGEGSGYNCFAGREASRAMAKLSFEEDELSNLNIDDLGPFDRSTLDDWIEKFKWYKNYPVIGRVSIPPSPCDFTADELLCFNGKQAVPEGRVNSPIYVCVNGKVLDVSYGGVEMYSEGGPYHIFAGIDASRALAKMSFKPEDLSSSDLSDLTEEQLKVLNDWETKFINSRKYPVVGYMHK